ncbi:MAG TPA: BatD family protein [Moheibacter sp.]|nr:BatD family protein [Moheibacter sp.]
MLKNTLLLVFIFCSAKFLWSQDVSFKAQASKTEVSVNERFIVQFILTYGQENISVDKPLNLPGFGKLHQLGESQINSFQFINGNVINQSGIEVMLVADQEGEFTIGSATVTIDGRRYKTNPIKISVKKGLKPKSQPGKRLQGAFLTAEISDNNPFLNQEVVLTVKLYARDYSILNRLRNYQEPDFNNMVAKFVSEKLEDDEKQVLVNGVTFIQKVLARYVLFPQKKGNLEIDPFALNVLISGYYGSENIQLTTDPIVLNVRELPTGKPSNFSGAIGNYKLNASLSKNELKANEATNLEVEIIGSGNLNTLKTPEIPVPENIETFAPKKKDAFEIRPSGMKGAVVENHVLVPQYGGEYKIGPVLFNYFDPTKEKYITLQTQPLLLSVDGPEPPKTDSIGERETLSDHIRNDSSALGKIVVPQKITEVKDKVVETVARENNWIWAIVTLLALLGGIFFWFNKKKKNPESSEKQLNSRFKTTINGKLDTLKSLAQKQDTPAFLSLQEEILTQIGMHYSQTNLSEFTESYVDQKLQEKYGNLAHQWKSLILECKQSKYAFSASNKSLMTKYKETQDIWKAFQK